MGSWWRNQWLRAQGVSEQRILKGTWKNPFMFEVYPPHCVVCERAWRPDRPYITLVGESYSTPNGQRWLHADLGIYGIHTGILGRSARYLCTEHADKWPSVINCQTGETVRMRPPPTWGQRAWEDMRYWTGSVLRFAYLLVQSLAARVQRERTPGD